MGLAACQLFWDSSRVSPVSPSLLAATGRHGPSPRGVCGNQGISQGAREGEARGRSRCEKAVPTAAPHHLRSRTLTPSLAGLGTSLQPCPPRGPHRQGPVPSRPCSPLSRAVFLPTERPSPGDAETKRGPSRQRSTSSLRQEGHSDASHPGVTPPDAVLSEPSQWHRTSSVWFFLRGPGGVTSTETENRREAVRAGGGRDVQLAQISAWEGEKYLETDGGAQHECA